MDTSSATEEIDLEEIIRETCEATGRLDHDQIIANATKNLSPEALVRQCFEGYPEPIMRRLFEYDKETLRDLIEGHEPEDILREVIDHLITPEAWLIYGSGVSPEVAKAFVRMREADRVQRNAEDALMALIAPDIMAACRTVWDSTHMTDPMAAANAMMSGVPAIADAFRKSSGGEPQMREIFADYYSDFLTQQAGDGGEA
jgi:hypothetical protein